MGKDRGRGFTLVELMIVVAILGILAAIAMPSLSRYVKKSRTVEAITHINKICAGAIAYYNTDHADTAGNILDPQFPGPTAPVESAIHCGCQPTMRCGGSTPTWEDPIWSALNFAVRDSHNYIPGYTGSGVKTGANFTAWSNSDLDCDGTISTFQRVGNVNTSTGDTITVTPPFVRHELE